jgi:uncharacterized coiled-coil protein SlyX
MDAILARLSQLEQEAREQKTTIARLSSENEAQRAVSDRLASENTRLSSNVAKLRTTVGDQERVIATLSTGALPQGHWVWKSVAVCGGSGVDGDGDAPAKSGRWVWSLVRPHLVHRS